MEIVKYTYRKPKYLDLNNLDKIDTIAIHHTANNNSIDTNTDHHIDSNGWNWLGYGYYVKNGIPYEVRGYKHINAGVLNHNDHVISVVVEGNYDEKIPSQNDLEAVQFVVDYLKNKLPHIKYIRGHNYFGKTSCPGKLFPLKKLILKEINSYEEILKQKEEKIKQLEKRIDLLERIIKRRIKK